MVRPGWDDYFLGIVEAVGRRATCDRGRCACIAVRGHRILATGYSASPEGTEHCDDAGHLLRTCTTADGQARIHCVRPIHAEQNAIAGAARNGQALAGTTFYCTMEPCRTCAMLIIAVGAVRVVAAFRYHASTEGSRLLRQARTEFTVVRDTILDYEQQRPG